MGNWWKSHNEGAFIVKFDIHKLKISGIDGGFKSSLTTVGKFYGIFGDKIHADENRKIVEDIVRIFCLYDCSISI